MEYNFNGTVIYLKDKLCNNFEDAYSEMSPQANLYVRVGNACNANCKFCEYHGKNDEFDFNKFDLVLQELKSRGILGKIQLTGGEPSMYRDRLIKILSLVRKYFPDRFIGINSNGYDLLTLIEVKDFVDNFAISRHHYDDAINRVIFNTNNIPNSNQLKVFIDVVGSDKVHFSCNLMKSYISNTDEIKKYLEFCSSIGCRDVGFVTLMPINEFADNEQVVFEDTGLNEDLEVLRYKQYEKSDGCCRCANYLYLCKSTNKFIDIYSRYAVKHNKTEGIISFSEDTLRFGFNSEIIKI